jgi:glucose/arabinose dehydrogenase
LIAGLLKAQTLYRFVIEDNELMEKETLIQGIGRIRDIEVDSEGYSLLVSENSAGGNILRMSPGL